MYITESKILIAILLPTSISMLPTGSHVSSPATLVAELFTSPVSYSCITKLLHKDQWMNFTASLSGGTLSPNEECMYRPKPCWLGSQLDLKHSNEIK